MKSEDIHRTKMEKIQAPKRREAPLNCRDQMARAFGPVPQANCLIPLVLPPESPSELPHW
jgi:hypothetical protein